MQSLFEGVDFSERIQDFELHSQLGNLLLKNFTFRDINTMIEKKVQELRETNFYKSIDVHYGVKPRYFSDANSLKHVYERKQEILHYEIETQKELLYQLSSAQNQEQLFKAHASYQQNLQIIKKRKEEVDYADFIPCVTIKGQKKWPIYGQVMQDFSRKGVGTLNIKFGYRSLFQHFDTLEFNLQTPIAQIKRKHYQIGLSWQNPNKNYGNFYTGFNFASNQIYKDIDETTKSIIVGINKNNHRFQLERAIRIPKLHGDLVTNITKGYELPSTKWSLKLNTKLTNTIQIGDITKGQYSQLVSEATLPFLSQSKFVKVQYNYRKFLDAYPAYQYFDNKLLKNLFLYSSIQGNLSVSLIASQKNYISDLIENIDIRGFEAIQKPINSISNIKSSLKLNVYNYPGLSSARIIPFFYAQVGASFLKEKKMRWPYILGSGGIGLAYYISPNSQLQVVYSLLQFQSKAHRQPVNFQIRIGVFD